MFLLVILTTTFFKTTAGEKDAKGNPTWEWAGDGLVGLLLHNDLKAENAKLRARLDSETLTLAGEKPEALEPEQLETKRKELEAKLALNPRIQFWRNIDRLVMVGTFAFFSILVAIAWRRRRAEGRDQ